MSETKEEKQQQEAARQEALTPPKPKSAPIRKAQSSDIKTLLQGEAFMRACQDVLPKHLTPERMVRVAIAAMNKTPKLAQCDQKSFFSCMISLSQWGLEPDGRSAHLIPFWNKNTGTFECQLIIDYKGMVDLAMRTGKISNIHADVVCDNDVFEYDLGEVKCHKIDFRKPRGNVYAVYCIVRMKDGSVKCEVMSREDVESVRKRSKAANSGPWVTDWNEMAKKTVFKRCSKWLPVSPEVMDAMNKDEDWQEQLNSELRHRSMRVSAPSVSGEQGKIEAALDSASPANPEEPVSEQEDATKAEENAHLPY